MMLCVIYKQWKVRKIGKGDKGNSTNDSMTKNLKNNDKPDYIDRKNGTDDSDN